MNTNLLISIVVTYLLIHLACGIFGYLRLLRDVTNNDVRRRSAKMIKDPQNELTANNTKRIAQIDGVQLIILLDSLIEGPYALRWFRGTLIRMMDNGTRSKKLKLLKKMRKLGIKKSDLKANR